MSAPRPPRDITPRDFFESWLPEQYRAAQARAGGTPPDGAVCVTLSGDGGGAWTLRTAGGQLSVADGTIADALLALEQSVEDWRSLMVAADDSGAQLPAARLDSLFTNPGIHEALAAVKGTLTLEVPGFQERTFRLGATFNGAAEPAAGISVEAATIEAIQKGQMNPPEAFFSGKIQITGDQAFAMQLGMTMMQKMNG